MGFGYGTSAEVNHNADAFSLESGDRVQKRFTNDMTAHVWAQRRQTFGQSGKGVVYFHGRALFDYGEHYCAAYIVADDSAVLINATHVSPTTSGHVSAAEYAARPRDRFRVPDLTGLLAGRDGASLRAGPATWGSVDGTREFESAIDSRLGDREHVRAYCERHALQLAPDAMQFLLAGVGLPNSADKIRREAEARRDREAAEAERAERESAIALLRDVAKAESVAAYVVARASGYADGSDARPLAERLAGHIRKARRAAGKDNVPVTYWREAWARLGRLDPDAPDSEVPAIASALDAQAARRARGERVRALRNALINWKAPRDTADSPSADAHAFQRLKAEVRHAGRRANYAGRVAAALAALYPSTGARAIASLSATESKLDSYAEAIDKGPAMTEARAQWEAEADARREAERLERERIERESLAIWRAGGDPGRRIYASRESGAAYIRAVDVKRDESGAIVGGRLETSQGADVPLVEAVRAFRFIKLVRERGEPWHANGAQVRVGHFGLDRITAAGDMRAGCHAFQWQDIADLARELGVFDVPADDSAVTRSREHA